MRALQYFPTIEDPNTRRSLFEVLYYSLDIFHTSSDFTILIKPVGCFPGSTKNINGNWCCEKCEQEQCFTCCSVWSPCTCKFPSKVTWLMLTTCSWSIWRVTLFHLWNNLAPGFHKIPCNFDAFWKFSLPSYQLQWNHLLFAYQKNCNGVVCCYANLPNSPHLNFLVVQIIQFLS